MRKSISETDHFQDLIFERFFHIFIPKTFPMRPPNPFKIQVFWEKTNIGKSYSRLSGGSIFEVSSTLESHLWGSLFQILFRSAFELLFSDLSSEKRA